MGETVVRLAFSLAVVIGLIIVLARVSGRLRVGGGRTQDIKVVSRQALGRTASLTVAEVHGRTLLLGVTDQQISLITDLTAVSPGSAFIPAPQLIGGTHAPVVAPLTAAVTAPGADTDTDTTVAASFADELGQRLVAPVGGESPAEDRKPGWFRASAPSHRAPVPANSPLAGSVLSRESWRAAFSGLSRAS